MSKFSKLYSVFDEIEEDKVHQSSSEKFYNNFANQLISNTSSARIKNVSMTLTTENINKLKVSDIDNIIDENISNVKKNKIKICIYNNKK